MAFYIIVDARGVAVAWITKRCTNLLNEYVQANTQLLVIAAQAAILFRIAGQRTARDKRPSKEDSLNQGDE
jgi:uncharacterized membrane protein (DUF441 family)